MGTHLKQINFRNFLSCLTMACSNIWLLTTACSNAHFKTMLMLTIKWWPIYNEKWHSFHELKPLGNTILPACAVEGAGTVQYDYNSPQSNNSKWYFCYCLWFQLIWISINLVDSHFCRYGNWSVPSTTQVGKLMVPRINTFTFWNSLNIKGHNVLYDPDVFKVFNFKD